MVILKAHVWLWGWGGGALCIIIGLFADQDPVSVVIRFGEFLGVKD